LEPGGPGVQELLSGADIEIVGNVMNRSHGGDDRLGASHEHERVAALRREAWDVLEDYRLRRVGGHDARVMVGLQDIANRLGSVEALLEALPETSDLHGAPATDAEPPPLAVDASRTEPDMPVGTDAAILLALADVSVPLAASRVDEAERWLRVMRDHGNVGRALQELGMAPAELATPSLGSRRGSAPRVNPVTMVATQAATLASERGAQTVTTVDVLFAVISQYGPVFDRVLYAATGKTRSALLSTLVESPAPTPA
jgi:hypothetical protein